VRFCKSCIGIIMQLSTLLPILRCLRTTHIEIDYHLIQEKLWFKEIYPNLVRSNDQLVDVLTKSLRQPQNEFIRSKFGTFNLYVVPWGGLLKQAQKRLRWGLLRICFKLYLSLAKILKLPLLVSYSFLTFVKSHINLDILYKYENVWETYRLSKTKFLFYFCQVKQTTLFSTLMKNYNTKSIRN